MNIGQIRKDFPFFDTNPNIAYLDSAATTQKPQLVLEGLQNYYSRYNSNANRGAYKIAVKSTDILESTRSKVKEFINGPEDSQIIFTKSATESLNLVSYAYGLNNLNQGDQVLISVAEHHANLVNWQYVCKKTGADLVYFDLDQNLNLDIEDFKSKLNEKTKIVAFTGGSNVLNFHVPISEIVREAKKYDAITLVDGTQLIAHNKVNVSNFDCDLFAFSGHKLFAAQGVGVLYGKNEILNDMDPFLLGGDMIDYVSKQETTYKEIPHKFEAGTLDIAAIYTLKLAIEYIEKIGYNNIINLEKDLVDYAFEKFSKLDFVDLYMNTDNKGTNFTFTVKDVHPHDVSQVLDFYDVDIRVGHHCAQVLHKFLGVPSTCRASIAFYNTHKEIDRLIEGLEKVKDLFYGN